MSKTVSQSGKEFMKDCDVSLVEKLSHEAYCHENDIAKWLWCVDKQSIVVIDSDLHVDDKFFKTKRCEKIHFSARLLRQKNKKLRRS